MLQSLRHTGRWFLVLAFLTGVFASGGCEWQRETEDGAEFAESPPEQPSHPLVGQAAPGFTADRLGGGEVALQEHQGDVVLLDFWATWCPPCVEGLPKVAKVASELREQGVAFYAVNVGEDAETVEAFLNEQGLDVPVLMDTDSSVAQAYGADAIPQTVLIGPDGTVQAVHVGLSGNMEATLRQQLGRLLEGQSLTPQQG